MTYDVKLTEGIAVISSKNQIITNAQSALDLLASINYNYNTYKIAVDKSAVHEDFFKLSTGLAGEIVQKFVNYNCRLAIIGDFSSYTSKPLQDYIYECNKGRHLFFVANEQEAIARLKGA
ncbi:MAG: DUF4180 domain-containing protein [Oscillospiraceae bacterium]|jgi:hypothetical protein|nr:DUF4180 domain-containing protein [Oscillospiraceae bacterium]